jgi:hypothetical protein
MRKKYVVEFRKRSYVEADTNPKKQGQISTLEIIGEDLKDASLKAITKLVHVEALSGANTIYEASITQKGNPDISQLLFNEERGFAVNTRTGESLDD